MSTPIVLALHTFASGKLYFSVRNGTNDWVLSKVYAQNSDVFGTGSASADTRCSAGIESEADYLNPRGVIVTGLSGPGTYPQIPWFAGQGEPAAMYPIACDNLPSALSPPYTFYNTSAGAWLIGTVLWALLFYSSGGITYVVMAKSIAYDANGIPTLWHAVDQSNAPTASSLYPSTTVRWDGLSLTIDVMAGTGFPPKTYSLYSFDTVSETWGSPYGTIVYTDTIYTCTPGVTHVGNGLVRYPNGDIAIVYEDAAAANVYYRLYSGGAWGTPVVIVDAATLGMTNVDYGQILVDPSGEALHVFTLGYSGSLTYGQYSIVSHGGTVQSNLNSFYGRIHTDGFGHSCIIDGTMYVAFDDWADGANACLVGAITGGATSWSKELIPVPPAEVGANPTCCYLFPSLVMLPPTRGHGFVPQYIKRRNLFGH